MLKHLTVCITTICGKFFKRWEYRTTLPAPEKSICRLRSNSQNWTWNNGLVPNWERSMSRMVYCHCAYLIYMQSTSCEMPGWMNHKLESRSPNINNLRYADDTTLMAESKEHLDEGERREWKSWLKIQHSKNKDHGIWCHHFMANRTGRSNRFYFIGFQNHCRQWLQPWN